MDVPRRHDAAQAAAVAGEDPEAAGARDEDVPPGVDLDAVDGVLARRRRQIGEHAAGGVATVGLTFVAHHHLAIVVPVPDVEGPLVRRQRQAVGARQLLRDDAKASIRVALEDAAERQFLSRIGGELRQAERRIGEEQRAVRPVDQVVRRVQPLALETVGEDVDLAVGAKPGDTPVAVLVDGQAALRVEGEAVRAGLPVVGNVGTVIARRRAEGRQAPASVYS